MTTFPCPSEGFKVFLVSNTLTPFSSRSRTTSSLEDGGHKYKWGPWLFPHLQPPDLLIDPFHCTLYPKAESGSFTTHDLIAHYAHPPAALYPFSRTIFKISSTTRSSVIEEVSRRTTSSACFNGECSLCISRESQSSMSFSISLLNLLPCPFPAIPL